MSDWRFLFLVVLIIVAAGFASKPDYPGFLRMRAASIESAFGQALLVERNEVLTEAIRQLNCTSVPEGCPDRVREGLQSTYRDVYAFWHVRIDFERIPVAQCVGIFNNWICTKG